MQLSWQFLVEMKYEGRLGLCHEKRNDRRKFHEKNSPSRMLYRTKWLSCYALTENIPPLPSDAEEIPGIKRITRKIRVALSAETRTLKRQQWRAAGAAAGGAIAGRRAGDDPPLVS
jgi:hypothetical protein